MRKLTIKWLGLFSLIFIFCYNSTHAQSGIKFAVIGDFGKAGSNESDVADLVHSWNPDFIITAGDNNYENGAQSTIDENIGQYYHDFIYPYTGSYGNGAPDSNLFFPTLGNHDWRTPNLTPYLDYFVLNTNGKSTTERYYTVIKGDIEFFMLDSDSHEPDGNTYNSTQGQWFQDAVANSTAVWKIAVFHHPPYSSDSEHGNNSWMQWDFYGTGVPVVISGHAHTYERINLNNTVYYVNGLGGKSIYSFSDPVLGSQVRYNGDYGAMLVEGNADSLTFKFINVSNDVIDSYTVYPEITSTQPELLNTFNFDLKQNFPNPFNPETKISFSIPNEEFVQLSVFNLLGQKVQTLLSETLPAGKHEVSFDGQNLPSGIYIYKINAGGYLATQKMILMK